MVKMRLACQTITWDNQRTEKRDYTVEAVARAGYEGMEIGARFLDLNGANRFRDTLDRNGVQLVALHTGWNPFLDPARTTGGSELDQAITFARKAKVPFLIMSGNESRQTSNIDTVSGLNAVGRQCAENGVVFCYHNHWWEVRDQAALLKEIASRTDPALVSFCPDIGWIRKTTPNVVDTLRIIEARIRIVHFKDYVADGLEVKDDETEFGRGILDFDEAFALLAQLPLDQLWIVAEQWKSSVNHLPPEASIQANREFLSAFCQ
ncbi:MAG: sugar phosphate isomerase/epimerase [Lentisphaerae bacterium]|jgi:sugar phosphate isomerase/epimerase|nr:sugar phosphate isomerase/epimerase [Lentisphaerota bacterium]MBT4821542.1 sugar phosphate isomerase/epimerase [Lentisphaerota bacterium]MBT5608410.1 sugar phosphate isomerase/epimerase [Lentisphaerota bacterium]MBT7054970.1 sugar phosphate isomerase/epimerase [Lentisphaerota bacterium]MBT7844833.1 sugar phosphate isomerase/epimerase [Lentisphaerota bacterium]